MIAISRVLRRSPAAARAFANAMAPVQQVAVDDLVEDPGGLRLRRRDRLAVGAHLDASATPASRGSRCVPPAPGMMPSSTSGWPTFASFAATR